MAAATKTMSSAVHIALNGKSIFALFDSGASSISCVSDVVFYNLDNGQVEKPDFTHVKGIAGQYSAVIGSCTLSVTLGNNAN